MDPLHLSNPLSTVQIVPIFTYLHILSNFLFLENYLIEVDQYKPIPIVNGLYQYLENHRDNQQMIVLLIRNLLQGSDLYGEQENDKIDQVFVNAMFDYIISSLVFDKYGNIYGFLVDTIRQAENLQYNYVLNLIKEKLKNATFENEYVPCSTLTQLSINRIFDDIILPLFPEPLTYDINLLSLDYIYAQAGSSYLRIGRLNETYYSNFKQFSSQKKINRILFDDYIATGYIIEKLYQEKVDPIALKAFALPALFLYISTEENKNENVTNLIFNPSHWERVYRFFFRNITNANNKIEKQLLNDYTFRIHRAFTNFDSRAKFAKLVLDYACRLKNKHDRETSIPVYLEFAEHFECRSGEVLPNINEWYQDQIKEIGKLYEKYDLEITRHLFNESKIGDLRDFEIHLIHTVEKIVKGNLDSLDEHLPFDLLEFFNTNNKTSNYYALKRENYSASLIKEADDPMYFRHIVGPPLDDFILFSNRTILKFANESGQKFLQELIKYKKDRFMSFLNYFDNGPKQSEWWKEFGLSHVPLYPCLSNITNHHDILSKVCEKENIKFLNKNPDVLSTELIDTNTLRLLFSLGTTIRTVFMKEIIEQTVNLLLTSDRRSTLSGNFLTEENALYQKLSLHLEEPKFEISCYTKERVKFLQTVINHLAVEIQKSFKSAKNVMNNLLLLRSTFIISIDDTNNLNQSLFIRSWNGLTGYGYKFSYVDEPDNETITAQLINGNEFKEDDFLLPIRNQNKKISIKFINKAIKCETEDMVCKVINQPAKNSTKISFYGISDHHHNDDRCNIEKYFEKTKGSNICIRQKLFIEKTEHDRMIVYDLLAKNKTYIQNITLENQIRSLLKLFTFPNNKTRKYFFNNWLKDPQFINSNWSKSNIIDTSGLLNEQLYEVNLDIRYLPILKVEKRINSTYTYRERFKIEKDKSLENIIEDYNNQKADYSVTLEDYYAIRNFATKGYRRIAGDTREAKLMKLALYKLALRQSNDFDEEFELKLYGFDSMPMDSFKRQFIKENSVIMDLEKSITLQKFTITHTIEKSALRFAKRPPLGVSNILYEMKFYGPYSRAKIDVEIKQSEDKSFREKRVILPPGTEFHIERVALVIDGELDKYFRVVLASKTKSNDKYGRCKTIMKQIAQIKL